MSHNIIKLARFFRIGNNMFPTVFMGLYILKALMFRLNLQKKDYVEKKWSVKLHQSNLRIQQPQIHRAYLEENEPVMSQMQNKNGEYLSI